jgi:hypothetical protein
MKSLLSKSLLLLSLSTSIFASDYIRFGLPDYVNFQETLMVMNAYGVPLNPIEKDKKEFKLVPVYATADSLFSVQPQGGDSINSINVGSGQNSIKYTENEASGGGFVFNWFHGLGDNWGYSITASHIRLSGETMAFAEYNGSGNNVATNFADEDGHATQAMAYLVYDPLRKKQGFSLPLFVGVGAYLSSQEATLSKVVTTPDLAGVRIDYKSEIDEFTMGMSLGFAFQYNSSDFQLSTFILAYLAPNIPKYRVNATRADTGAKLLNDFDPPVEEDTIFPSGGFSISYIPWGLSYSITPNIFNLIGGDESQPDFQEETSQTVMTLSKTWTWK